MVCDGAGSAQYGGQGARLVCRTFEIELRRYFAATTTQPTDEELWNWVDAARDRMAVAAEKRSIARQAFASTLVLLVVSGNETLVVHIGDGAVVARDLQQSWRALSWPKTANTHQRHTSLPTNRRQSCEFRGLPKSSTRTRSSATALRLLHLIKDCLFRTLPSFEA